MRTFVCEDALAELFTDLHHARLVADGKEISDAVLRKPPEAVLAAYRHARHAEGFDLRTFFQEHFEKAPERHQAYQSDTRLSVEEHITRLWDVLKREPTDPDYYSTRIRLPYPYIVPGGRFNEIYYWDSYFTMLGLQVSGRMDLLQSMVDNFSWMIAQYGFIPNGSRTYYLGRSQPPFYALMVRLLADAVGEQVLGKYLPYLEQEYAFWMAGAEETTGARGAHRRVVALTEGRILNRYYDDIQRPRTEMYLDDVELIERQPEHAQRMILDIRAACESGWDFSSRWCAVSDRLDTIHTTDILPVDLNALLYYLEQTLADAHRVQGNANEQVRYVALAEQRKAVMQAVFWNEATAFYHDYDFVQGASTPVFSLAAMFPLFFGIATPEQAAACARRIEADFLRAGGLLTTCEQTGQQWDAPNGWAPLQWMAIQGLRCYGYEALAETIAERWIALNVKVYKATGKLMEKYNVVDTDLESGGGEYPVQDGFGWTNGVLLALMQVQRA